MKTRNNRPSHFRNGKARGLPRAFFWIGRTQARPLVASFGGTFRSEGIAGEGTMVTVDTDSPTLPLRAAGIARFPPRFQKSSAFSVGSLDAQRGRSLL